MLAMNKATRSVPATVTRKFLMKAKKPEMTFQMKPIKPEIARHRKSGRLSRPSRLPCMFYAAPWPLYISLSG